MKISDKSTWLGLENKPYLEIAIRTSSTFLTLKIPNPKARIHQRQNEGMIVFITQFNPIRLDF
jgi:hypothetical protein